ncbi:MAG: hypothetical protein HY808_14450 [Nitrospirae bacterium]|nr:hypothetical protein [Nitrospirota bacterium]
MSYWDNFPRYVSVAEKKAKAAKKLKQLSRKNPNLKPVILQGSAIARTWWGKAWNLNLDRYADYHNRIGRGRSYVRHGAVLDLQIDPGEARASVQGSQSSPYSVVISIRTLKKDIWQTIINQCQGMLESLQELINGSFPKTMGEIFTHKDSGMFPSSKEIKFSCSCPDWAGMCKHVAAALYGIGARLDESPELFFRMRNVEMDDLIGQAISDHRQKLLARASKKSSRIIEEADLSQTFGIELEHDLGTASSVSLEDTVPVSSRNSKKTASSAKSKSPAKGPLRKKGSKRTKKALTSVVRLK